MNRLERRIFRLNLSQKALICVFVPMLVQLGLLCVYGTMLDKWQALAEHENHSKEILGRTNWLSCLVPIGALAGLAHAATHNSQDLWLFDFIKQKLSYEFKQVKEISDRADLKMEFDQAEQVYRHLYALVDSLSNARSDNEIVATLRDERTRADWQKLFEIRKRITYLENTSFRSDFLNDAASTNVLKSWIGFMVIAIAASAAWLLYSFGRQITHRLLIMGDNIERFSKRQKLNPLLPGSDEVSQLDKAFHDMSERLAVADRKKQEYISMLNHDMRIPLSNALTALELIGSQRHGVLNERGMTLLNGVDGSLNQLLLIINEFLELEKMESGAIVLNKVRVSLKDLFRLANESIRELAAAKQLTVELQEADIMLKCDGEKMVRVMVNLLGNSIKFSPERGTIRVTAQVTAPNHMKAVEIQVSDEGRGIPPEFMERIFERFQQVDDSDGAERGGTGLGLAICKAIVSAHHGEIGARNNASGRGSTFWFRIPVEE